MGGGEEIISKNERKGASCEHRAGFLGQRDARKGPQRKKVAIKGDKRAVSDQIGRIQVGFVSE